MLVKKEGSVTTLILNRPEVYNAINLQMAVALSEELVSLAEDRQTRAIVIRGSEDAFCAGGDLKWILALPAGCEVACHLLAGQFHLAITEIRTMGKPVIAAVNGVAAGGGFSLALACDFRVMSDQAALRQAYTSSGLCIDGGGTFMLPRLIGIARALEIAAFDRPIDAQRAVEWGLVSEVVRNDQVDAAAMKLAKDLTRRSMNSFAWSKRLFNDSFQTGLETQLKREQAGIVACASHLDGKEGLRAFTEKRKPQFLRVDDRT